MRLRSVLIVLAIAAASLTATSAAQGAPTWAPASSSKIHPGVQTFTDGAQCTANFVFYDASTVYLGQAAHCSGTGSATDTNGCQAASLPIGTKVDIGGSRQGTMVYNSWITMQQLGEKDPDTCAYNDLALVQVDPADAGRVNPSIPFWGGPTGITSTVPDQAKVLSYGNSELRLGITQLSPKQGIQLWQNAGGWNHAVYTATPGIPGDSGSGFLDKSGRGFGILSTVAIAPLAGSNGVGDLGRELAYARAHGLSDLAVVNGTEPFTTDIVGAILAAR
jgi:hypothetical protein